MIKQWIKKIFLYVWYQELKTTYRALRNKALHKRKEIIVRRCGRRFQLATLIETGTYEGAMVAAMRTAFQQIYSIELSKNLALAAQKRFTKNPHITILQGDSIIILDKILKGIKSPALFWLDAHYSKGETVRGPLDPPTMKELEIIFDHKIKNHVILIDDARLFNGTNNYPKFNVLKKFVLNINPNLEVKIQTDIIRIFPQRS